MQRVWPAVLAVFGPGVAQAYVKRRRAAAIFLALFAVSIAALAFSIYALAFALAVLVASIVDMIVCVVQNKEPRRGELLDAAIAWGATIAIAILARTFLVEAYKIPASSMYPTLEIDDHVLVSKLAGAPERGDLIVFEQPCARRDYVKRVVALANDTVEIRCNMLVINGKAVPTELVEAQDQYRDRYDLEGEWVVRHASRYREQLGGHTYHVFDHPERPERGEQADAKDFPLEGEPPSCRTQRDFRNEPAPGQQPGTIVDTAPASAPCAPHRHYVVPAGHVFVLGDNRSNSNDSRFWGAVPVGNVHGTVSGIWLPVGRFGPVD